MDTTPLRRLRAGRLTAVLLAGAGVVVAATLPAYADGSPAPADTASASSTPTPAPDPSSPSSPPPGPTPEPTSTITVPALPSSGGTASADPAPLPTTAAPAPTASPTPGPGARISDGVLPVDVTADAYLQLTEQRDAAVARLASATADLLAARSLVTDVVQRRQYAATLAEHAHLAASARHDDVGAVARQMYQQGDSGIGYVAAAIGQGPEEFFAGLDTARQVSRAASGVVDSSQQADAAAALADAQTEALSLQLTTVQTYADTALATVTTTRADIAVIDTQLRALDVVPPQVAVGPEGCPKVDVPGTLRDGSDLIGARKLCRSAIRQAATPQAALAITWAFQHLGAAYACGGTGRLLPFRMDCSSFVSRAYHEGAGIGTAGPNWAPSTRDMVPWDGVRLDRHYALVAPGGLRPGDLVLYDTCPQGGCPYKHVVMYLGSPDGGRTFWMAHTNACGDIAKVEAFWGFPTVGHPFLVARRVLVLPGEKVTRPAPLKAAAKPAR